MQGLDSTVVAGHVRGLLSYQVDGVDICSLLHKVLDHVVVAVVRASDQRRLLHLQHAATLAGQLEDSVRCSKAQGEQAEQSLVCAIDSRYAQHGGLTVAAHIKLPKLNRGS